MNPKFISHNEHNAQKKLNQDVVFFNDLVTKHLRGKNTQNKKLSKVQEEILLFGKKEESVLRGVIDDNIPVQRSGARFDEFPPIESFAELEKVTPVFVSENVKLMKYETPTPIQKYAIPVGLGGLDLMCCAQTVSECNLSMSRKPIIVSC
jgi:hypothetical protein